MATAYQPNLAPGVLSSHWEQSIPPDNEVSFAHVLPTRIGLSRLSRLTVLLIRYAVQNLPFSNYKRSDGMYPYSQPQTLLEPFGHQMTTNSRPSPQNLQNFGSDSPTEWDPAHESDMVLKSQRSANNMHHYEERYGRDTYSDQPSRPSAPHVRNTGPSRKTSVASGMSTEEVDDAWIHRDKLAEIETREMVEAGIRVPRSNRHRESQSGSRSASRSASRASARRVRSRDRLATHGPPIPDGMATAVLPSFEEHEPTAIYTTEDGDLSSDGALETFARRSQDPYAARDPQQYSRNLTRPGTSRIPIARSSPAPVSNAVVERDSPLPRTGAGSSSVSGAPGDGIAYKKRRSHSLSLGSQAIVDGYDNTRTSTSRPVSAHLQNSLEYSPPGSSSKAKPDTRSVSNPTGRKAVNARIVSKPRATSATHRDSPGSRRPLSSSAPRPTSAINRPEGEAPWIATMYKPDPMLPPDQQILPTHAKRILQEQWGSEGKPVDAHDQNFNLLNDNELKKMGAFPPTPAEQPWDQQHSSQDRAGSITQSAWPFSGNITEIRSGPHSPRPGTSGGYKITPTIDSPSVPQRPGASPGLTDSRKPSVQRVPDVDEKAAERKSKGCGCCIVM